MTESPRRILIVGAGGFGRETASAIRALESQGRFVAAGFADDSVELHGQSIAGLPVLGGTDIARDREDLGVVVTVGNPRRYDVKRKIVHRLNLNSDRYVSLVHPRAAVGTEVVLGEGTVILAGCVVTHGATIGSHVAMMPNVVVTHDDIIGAYVTIGAGAKLGGGVEIGAGAYIGSGALVRESTAIGEGALIGMGAVVLNDVPPGETWVGVPARPLSSRHGS